MFFNIIQGMMRLYVAFTDFIFFSLGNKCYAHIIVVMYERRNIELRRTGSVTVS